MVHSILPESLWPSSHPVSHQNKKGNHQELQEITVLIKYKLINQVYLDQTLSMQNFCCPYSMFLMAELSFCKLVCDIIKNTLLNSARTCHDALERCH